MGATTCKNCGSLNQLMKPCKLCRKPAEPTYITLQEYLKHSQNPAYAAECGPQVRQNALELLLVINNLLMELIHVKLLNSIPTVTSGWRPAAYNKSIGGSLQSKHIKGLAIDLLDSDRTLGNYLVLHQEALAKRGLAMEALSHTLNPQPWVHLQLGFPKSGRVVFIP